MYFVYVINSSFEDSKIQQTLCLEISIWCPARMVFKHTQNGQQTDNNRCTNAQLEKLDVLEVVYCVFIKKICISVSF